MVGSLPATVTVTSGATGPFLPLDTPFRVTILLAQFAMLPPYLKLQPDGVWLSLKVQPRASRNEIGGAMGGELKIKVTAPPVDSAANEALLGLLAETLDCPKNAVRLVRGKTSRHKTVLISGMTPEAVARRLEKGAA
jgi:uncharacterized protein